MPKTELAVQGKFLDVSLKEGITASDAMKVVDDICTRLQKAETSVEHTRLLLGRLLADVQDRELYRPDHASFEQFTLALAEKHRLSRPTLRNALMVARRLPELSVKEAESIPGTSLTLIARAAATAEPRQIKKLNAEAQGKTILEFRDGVMSRGLVGRPGRPHESARKTVTVKIPDVSRAIAGKWGILLGSRKPAALFAELVNAAIGEAGQRAA